MKLKFVGDALSMTQPDPYILKADDGKYYIYATDKNGVRIFRADALDGIWTYVGIERCEKDCYQYWAPCVVYENGLYYMYYSSFRTCSEDVHEQAIKVAVSDRPDGGFVYKKTMLSPFSIDPHVVKSGDDYYIFYSTNDYEAERAGTYIAVDRMTDMFTVEGKPVPVVLPTLDEEIFMRDRFRVGQNWHTIEGAFYFRKGDDHYLMYSGNCFENEHYFIGYAHAHCEGNDLTKLHFRKYPNENTYAPLLCTNREEEGTGHNSVLDENGKYYIVYHARDLHTDVMTEHRTARYRQMLAEGNKLTVI